ncbi:nucleotide exchange factor GrpE [Syntrophomonas wolfei]|jgi:molecular chaperone GrpE|uniref:Protein GrpE n=1 Tax=Syntrophomonas wolfei TaxID=863 RepID=A0A354YW97_9FIRM|nr:nucleotide exchange factor GrpE [Syntrophomonas wolfei]HBK53618.1 nucleotide exchange factor GrpE [Syntrophomonas wolfei]
MTKEELELEKEQEQEIIESVEASTIVEGGEIQALKEELARLQEEKQENYDLYLRALAEQENIKKRAGREREEYIKFAALPLIKRLLPVIDDLDRALDVSHANQDLEALNKGVEMIARKLHELIKNEGVEAIEAVGKPFDPMYHQPLMVEGSSEEQENMVIEEFQKGYIMHGRVIRPSLVKVSNS